MLKRMRKKITVGILAHVDAGKTTLIESLLYTSGQLRSLGRVDHKNAFLDYHEQERDRGITIFSKEAAFSWKNADIHVIDTPGHIDFSSEMERTLKVLDLAILIINGQDGVQSHTETIWRCLEHYQIPVLMFINKMDVSYHSKEELMKDLHVHCSHMCTEPSDTEKIACANESLLNTYLETEEIPVTMLQEAVFQRQVFLCYFGSALKLHGIRDIMDAIVDYSLDKAYGQDFGAKIYKISYDEQGHRLTHVKVTSGSIKVKQKIATDQKIDQIRIYNGNRFKCVQEANAGTICTLVGLTNCQAGQGLGIEPDSDIPVLNAYLNYQLILPKACDPVQMMDTCKILAAQDPQLHISYDENTKTISLRLMGDIQMEVLQKRIQQLSGFQVGFGNGIVLYKETIKEPVTGIGHFEPLRHYAEVHVYLEPLPLGSGLVFAAERSMDNLAQNWQRLIITHLQEQEHKGVLTGSPITDMKITVTAGKAHAKHTQGGDFRQAACRAVRQGLKKAHSVLLEPYYDFTLTLPVNFLGKALYDLELKQAEVQVNENMNGSMTIHGNGPVRTMINYQKDVIAYTKGLGTYTFHMDGYRPSPDPDFLVEACEYDSETDRFHPTGSIFCTHGSGFYVPYDEVESYMHIQLKTETKNPEYQSTRSSISDEEVKRVFQMASGRNRNDKKINRHPKKKLDLNEEPVRIQERKMNCLVVDGYNQIFEWEALRSLAHSNIGSARDRLIDLLSNYQGYTNYKVILVFDAYRNKDTGTRNTRNGNMDIIYTSYDQSADSYIERFVHDHKDDYHLMVATNDGLIQNSVLSHGAVRISSRELETRVLRVNEEALKILKEKRAF